MGEIRTALKIIFMFLSVYAVLQVFCIKKVENKIIDQINTNHNQVLQLIAEKDKTRSELLASFKKAKANRDNKEDN